jgi:tRNA 2-selenouridine synthase
MQETIEVSDFARIFLRKTPLLDVRSPCEFAKGSLPNAINIPLLNNKQREKIGICYKKYGKDAAMKMGFCIFDNQKIINLQQDWSNFFKKHKLSYLFCARGGQRSKISQKWLREYGIDIARIGGGFKSVRRFLLDELERICQQKTFLVLGGLTGVDKTKFLRNFKNNLDLEHLAHHKGSAFGAYADTQPSQINFENTLIIKLMKIKSNAIIIEDESAKIGNLNIPITLWRKKQQANLIILQADKYTRIENLYQTYISEKIKDFENFYDKETAYMVFCKFWQQSIDKIKKGTGGLLHAKLKKMLESALVARDKKIFQDIILLLIEKYYDPLYQKQLNKKKENIIFAGSREQVIDFVKKYNV